MSWTSWAETTETGYGLDKLSRDNRDWLWVGQVEQRQQRLVMGWEFKAPEG
jgi:hypothetical protein